METSTVFDIQKIIQTDENVLFYWSLSSVTGEGGVAESLLGMLVVHWITLQVL